jgi:hypothetical protein
MVTRVIGSVVVNLFFCPSSDSFPIPLIALLMKISSAFLCAFLAISFSVFAEPPTEAQINEYFELAEIQKEIDTYANHFQTALKAQYYPPETFEDKEYIAGITAYKVFLKQKYLEHIKNYFISEDLVFLNNFLRSEDGKRFMKIYDKSYEEMSKVYLAANLYAEQKLANVYTKYRPKSN